MSGEGAGGQGMGGDEAGAWRHLSLRESRESDMPAVQAIYADHVRHGFGSFEEEPPELAEMLRRRADMLGRGLPHVVAEADGAILGFAYAGPYRPRSAYRYTVEDSVYVARAALRRGLGRALLAEIVRRCEELGYRQMVAVIGDSGNERSIGVHRALGFAEVGRLPAVGYKLGRWVDIVIMQRALGTGDGTPPPLAQGLSRP
jgi:phosphinothricin acetyltransferase